MTLDAWRQERNKILAELDVDAAAAWVPGIYPREVVLMALHKARYDCTDIATELRHASAAWLREQGCTDMRGQPILPEGQLPR